jgi:hypothetical protein
MREPRMTFNDVAEMAERRVGIAGWKVYRWTAAEGGSICEGMVPNGVFERGPRKGKTRWEGADARTRRKVIVSDAEVIAHLLKLESETGVCSDCRGTKEVFASWSKAEGTKHRPCTRCESTGIAPKESTHVLP